MAYVALYRAYRPQKFSEVVGQQHIIKTLQNAIQLNKVAHAYLFCGPRGTGKTTMAKIMAKALNCEHGPTIEPCCECDVCKGIAKGMISDVVEIDAASNNGVEDVRALRDTVKFLPSSGRYKVYIIDEVHMLSGPAFNALLKTLEEPPAHVVFILATTEPYKLPNTILSRCQRFDFQSISIEDILKRLKIVAEEENINIDDEALHQIANSAEGGMRDALSLFDQCISYSVNSCITLDDVLAVSGNISYQKIIELLDSCISLDETKAIMVLDGILKEGKEVPRIINDIMLFLRDLLLFKNNAYLEKKLMFENEAFISLSKKISKDIVYKWLDILNEASNQMRFSTQKRAFLELAILKMNDNEQNAYINLSNRLEALEYAFSQINSNGNKPEKEVVSQYVPHIPTQEELSNILENDNSYVEEKPIAVEPIKEEISKTTVKEIATDEFITVKDVEAILNNGSRETRAKLTEIWQNASYNQIIERYTSTNFTIQMLFNGNVVAASKEAFIVVLQDAGFCNKVMLYQNFTRIIEMFNDLGLDIKDYICLPKQTWQKILSDWKSKYNENNLTPSLEEFSINVKKRVIPQVLPEETKKDEELEKINELFGDEIKILEE